MLLRKEGKSKIKKLALDDFEISVIFMRYVQYTNRYQALKPRTHKNKRKKLMPTHKESNCLTKTFLK